jgi:phosphatidylglycerophosphate synthase
MHSTLPRETDLPAARPRAGAADFRPELQFFGMALAHLAILLAATALLEPLLSTTAERAPLVVFALVTTTGFIGLRYHYPHHSLGLCNVVTHFRATLVALLAAPLLAPEGLAASPAAAWAVTGIAGLALALDGVDGWLARRAGLVSRFGARFDVEIDALLAIMLAVLAWTTGKAGIWVLGLGVIRYAFVAAGILLPWLSAPLPERLRRKAICALQLTCLVALQAPLLQPPASELLAAAVLVPLLWSFAIDIVWLARRRRTA